MTRQLRAALAAVSMLLAFLSSGCGRSNDIPVSGKLVKGGKPYTPPAGQRIVLTFYVMDAKDADGTPLPADQAFVTSFDQTTGTFQVPGANGSGIPPGKYRIGIFQGLTREGEKKAQSEAKPRSRNSPAIDRDTDFFKEMFGRTTSPIVRDVKPGEEVVVDLDVETPAAKEAQAKAARARAHGDD